MSLPPDPDEPTRRLPHEPAPPVYEREVAVAAPEDLAWREEVIDRLNSLRTAVVLVGVLAVAALGVALFALLTQEEESDARRGASIDRVSDLEERVEALEEDVDRAPSRDALSRVSESVDSVDERLGAVEERVERQGADGGASDQAVEDLQGDVQQVGDAVEQLGDAVEQLDQRVGAVEQQQEASP